MRTYSTPDLFRRSSICRIESIATDPIVAGGFGEFPDGIDAAQSLGGREAQVPFDLVQVDVAAFVRSGKAAIVQPRLLMGWRFRL